MNARTEKKLRRAYTKAVNRQADGDFRKWFYEARRLKRCWRIMAIAGWSLMAAQGVAVILAWQLGVIQ